MKYSIIVLLLISTTNFTHALLINEVMSNPVGDDSGREWIELYNDSDTDIDGSALTVSIKGGALIAVTPLSGGQSIHARGYAIIGSTVSGSTKFTQDYGNYSGPLFKSSISLVNTGVTSIELKSQGVTVDTLPSYTAAKEGSTYSLIGGSFVTGDPTPGEENKAAMGTDDTATTTTTGTQSTIAQAAPASSDIVLYVPFEKIVVAGAPSIFSVQALTHAGNKIDNLTYDWSLGDGGQKTGSTTEYRYFYPGRYVAQVEVTNGNVRGVGRINIKVVAPEMDISPVRTGKYGQYIDITNPSSYDIDVSGWRLSIDGVPFPFPKNTILAHGDTHFSGVAMGFASTTVASSTIIKILFPNLEELKRVYQGGDSVGGQNGEAESTSTYKVSPVPVVATRLLPAIISRHSPSVSKIAIASSSKATTTVKIITKKDTRLATFIRSLWSW